MAEQDHLNDNTLNINPNDVYSPLNSKTSSNFRNVATENGPQGNNSQEHEHVSVTLFPSKLERQYSNDLKDSGKSRFFDIIRQLIIVALMFSIFFGFLFRSKVNYNRKSEVLFRTGKCERDKHFSSKYSVIFDAGSTGSRVHVYEFQFCGDRLLNLVDEVFVQTKPGLSAFPENPKKAVKSLGQLLRKAWERVPKNLRRCTPIVLKATAGLRLLPSEKVAKILGSIKMWLDDQPFHLPRQSSGFAPEPVSVIDGSEEAVSAWVSVNFLQGHIGPKNNATSASPGTSVVLEMGGGSSQIVFNQNTTSSIDYPDGIVDLKFFGRQFQLYQHSFLGYGLIEARKAVKTAFIESKEKSLPFPCFPAGFEEAFKEEKLSGNSEGWAACQKLVQSALFSDKKTCTKSPCSINGVHQPAIPEKTTIYALSYINDRAGELGLNGLTGYTLNDIKKGAKRICSKSFTSEPLYESNPAICLDLTFIYTLLHDGYGIGEDRKINSGQTINNYETGWTLGSALSVIESAPKFCK